MLSGQIFYYSKVLDQIKFPLTADQAARLELMSLPYISAAAFSQINQEDIPNELKNLFISSYGGFLDDNNLQICSMFWQWLTTPLKRQDILDSISPRSDFQIQIKEWGREGFQFYALAEILKNGIFLNREDDLALFYGLKVLDKLTLYDKSFADQAKSFSFQKPLYEDKNITYSTKPQILVITSDELSPLFVNLGCEATPFLNNKEKLLLDVKNILDSETSLKVVLVEGREGEEYSAFLRKHISSEILVSSIIIPTENSASSSSSSTNSTYFDTIARSTLGVRLD